MTKAEDSAEAQLFTDKERLQYIKQMLVEQYLRSLELTKEAPDVFWQAMATESCITLREIMVLSTLFDGVDFGNNQAHGTVN